MSITQKVSVEMDDGLAVNEFTRLVEALSEHETGIERISIEIDSSGDLDLIGTIQEVTETSAAAENEQPELPPLQSGSNQHRLARVLQETDGVVTAPELVDMSRGTEWEMNDSQISAALYALFQKGIVERDREDGSPYEYRLTELGERVLAATAGDEN